MHNSLLISGFDYELFRGCVLRYMGVYVYVFIIMVVVITGCQGSELRCRNAFVF